MKEQTELAIQYLFTLIQSTSDIEQIERLTECIETLNNIK